MENRTKDGVNGRVPGPEEPRWVVLVCTTEPVYDPDTGKEDFGSVDLCLYRTVAPLTDGQVDTEDPSTWADRAIAHRCQRHVSDFIAGGLTQWGTPGSTAYIGFVADGELYLAFTDRPPVPISRERVARVIRPRKKAS